MTDAEIIAALRKQVADLQEALKPEVVEKCWIDETDLSLHQDWTDDSEGYPRAVTYFECERGHYYHADYDGADSWTPTDEGLDETWSMRIRDLEDELRGVKGRGIDQLRKTA